MPADTVRLQSLISDIAEKNRAHICGLFVIVREGGDAEASFDGRALASRFSSVSSPIPAEIAWMRSAPLGREFNKRVHMEP